MAGLGKRLVEDLGDDEEAVGAPGSVLQDSCLGEALRDSILPDHVEHGDRVRRRLDAGDVEFVHLLHMIKDAPQLSSEDFHFLGRDLKPCKTREVGDINRVVG